MRPAAPVRIRPAVPADAAAIWAVHTRAIRHGCAAHYAPDEIAAWTARTTPATYAEPLLARVMVVAEAGDGRLAGFAQLEPAEGVIEGVYVDPDCARRGVGRALVGALEAEAARRGLASLVLDASLNAVPFYEALGYRVEADVRHALGGGRFLACKLMAKRLRPPPRARTPLASIG